MAANIPSIEPEKITAGDTIKWLKSFSDYSRSDGWVLSYQLRKDGGGQKIEFSTDASGADHLVNVSAATSGPWVAGRYTIYGFITKAATSERYQVYEGRIEILPNLATADEYYDGRSHARKVLDMVEAAIMGRADATVLSFNVEGQQIQFIPHVDLIVLHNKYRGLVANEDAANKIKQGLGSGRRILTRFN